MPKIGFGTARLNGDECTALVRTALDLGYRHIDTAVDYGNHISVGKAIQGFARDQLFITSKVELIQGAVETICDKSLKELGLDFLDMYLIHCPDRSQPMDVIVRKMENLKKIGKIKEFGVSNFTISHLKDLLVLTNQIACNQVEFHPYLYQKELWQFCKEQSIELEAFSPLGKGALLKDPMVCQIASSYQKTASQILLRWLYQKEIPFIVKASNKNRLEQNLNILDFSLREIDILSLDSLNCNRRFCDGSWSDFNYRGL